MKVDSKIKHHKNMALITAILLVVILVCFALPIAAEAETINPNIEFEKIDLLEELGSIKTFSFITYPPISSNEPITPTIYKVIEYCYSYYANYTANYGIYVYLYNPSQLELLENGKNKITLGTKYIIEDNAQKAVDYDKFDLKFISKIEGGAYNNLFYKFKIVDKQIDGKTMYERVNKVCRQYDIDEIELQEKGNFNANLLVGGGRFKFEGYAKGYGYDSEEESTLKCTQEGLDVLPLELKHTYFRTGTSSYGKGYQNQLDAVYFDVPNKYMRDYGNLTEIKAEWYEYKTSPIVVLHNTNLYDNVKGKEGVIDSSLHDFGTNYVYFPIDDTSYCDWGFNVPNKTVASKFKSNFLTYIYYCDKKDIKDWRLDGKDLQSYLYNYNKSYHTGTIDVYSSITNKNISNDLFVNFVDEGHTRGFNQKILSLNKASDYVNMMDYSSNHSGWQKFKDYFFSYPKDQSYENIPPIVPVENLDMLKTDEEISKKYFIDLTDVAEFKDYVNKSTGTVFKFNFGFSQYESNEIKYTYATVGEVGGTPSIHGIMSQETIYLDFDIIWLKFMNGLDETIIPVAALPIDAIADITPPPFLEDNDWWKILLEILKWIGIVIAVCMGLWLFVTLLPIIGAVLKIVCGVIALPFKAVGKLLKSGKSKAVKMDKQSSPPKVQRGQKYSADEAKMAKDRFKPKKE